MRDEVIYAFKSLFKVDSTGRVREWSGERRGGCYRFHSGVRGGKVVTSEWRYAEPKNVGRSNATTAEEQAEAELASAYREKRDEGYADSVEESGASFFEPMLAGKYDGWPKNQPFVYVQPKLDGIRCLVTPSGIHSRNGKPLPAAKLILEDLLRVSRECGIVFDGELYNHDLHDDFNSISSLVRKQKLSEQDEGRVRCLLQFHAYDCVDVQKFNMPFTERRGLLAALLSTHDAGDRVHIVETKKASSHEGVVEAHDSFVSDGYEGVMVRAPSSNYEGKRSKGLLKYKSFVDDEFEVVGLEEGVGNWSGAVKRVLVRVPGIEDPCPCGVRGTYDYLEGVLGRRGDFVGGKATVRYMNRTPDGMLRFPVATAIYERGEDKI